MAQLGSRLFFYSMDDRPAATDADLLATDVGESYRERLDRCRRHVGRLLSEVFEANGSVRGVKWDAAGDPSVVRQWLSRLARLVAAGRSEPSRDGDDSPGSYEAPHRAYAVLGNLARGHAFLYGRHQLADADLPLVTRVAVSSLPQRLARVFRELVVNGGEPLTVAEVKTAIGVRDSETATRAMRDLVTRGIAWMDESGQGSPTTLRLADLWAWCGEPDFRALLVPPATLPENRGVCA